LQTERNYIKDETMNDFYDDDEPQDWAKGSMNFNVAITNSQEDFFIREVADRKADKIRKSRIESKEGEGSEADRGSWLGRGLRRL